MLSYAKLWILIEKKGMKKTDLKKVISGNTLAKLGKNETVSSDIIEKICAFLDCQPGDIMEYISEKKISEATKQIDVGSRMIFEQLKKSGITEDEFLAMYQQSMPKIIKSMYNGENTIEQIFDEVIQNNITKNK